MRKFSNIVEAIGNTPIIELTKVHHGAARIFAKMEHLNPGASIKDRAALKIIQAAYRTGELQIRTTVVEMTSGNMGAGLAIVCGYYGNPLTVVMSRGNSAERVSMLENLGAKVVLVEQVDGSPNNVTGNDVARAAQVAVEIARETNAFYVDQFNRRESVLAHYETTGDEIWRQLDGKIDAFAASIGSGGTFVGVSKRLKENNPNVKCFAVEPLGAEVLAGKPVSKPQHILQGSSYGIIPPKWDARLCDGFFAISDTEAQEMKQRLAREQGLYVGFTAAANVCAAVKLAESGLLRESAMIATVLCDSGFKYQS